MNQTEKVLAILCHVCIFFGFALLLPLIVFLVGAKESPWLRDQAKEALNFHITLFIYGIVCVILMFVFIGFALAAVLGLAAAILAIIAAIRAAEGQLYRYPLTIRLV